jgi:glycine oxidase
MTGNPLEVVVVGGGIVGLSIAWRAARHGFAVTVADPDPGGGASHAAAGMLAPVSEAYYGEEALLALNRASHARWPGFAADLEDDGDLPVPVHTAGSLCVGFDDDDRRALDELHRFQSSLGLAVERLGSRQCRQLEPLLSPRVRGGVRIDGEANVDGRAVCRALLAALRRRGGRTVGESAVAVVHDGGRVAAVRLASGERVAADRVVLAAGSHTPSVEGVPADEVPPVRPVKGQVLRLRFDPADPPLARNVRALVRGEAVYLVPRASGELVVGATVEERGFDPAVTAGAVRGLLDAAVEVVPAVAELELVEATARTRPATPDGGPIIGPTRVDGLVLATGHHRNGVLLAPITADAVTGMLAGQPPTAEVRPFHPARFHRADHDRRTP